MSEKSRPYKGTGKRPDKDPKTGLSRREEEFCRQYIATWGNGAESARRAGYSEKCASNQASVMMARPRIRARIAELTAGTGVSLEQVEQARERLMARILELTAMPEQGQTAMAAVQACRLMADMLCMGTDGEKVRQSAQKIELEREKVALEKERLSAGQNAQTVQVVLDPRLSESLEDKKNPQI